MNTIDFILILILGFGLVKGFMRGLIIELASLLAVVIGIYGAIHFSFFTARIFSKAVENQAALAIVSFTITLVVIVLAVMLLARVLTKVVKVAALGLPNRLAGALFGMLKVAVIIGALFLFLEKTFQTKQWFPEETLAKSVLYKPVKGVGALVYDKVF